jgi:hypothetical protein
LSIFAASLAVRHQIRESVFMGLIGLLIFVRKKLFNLKHWKKAIAFWSFFNWAENSRFAKAVK